ncbi:MAG: hypothetical protein HY391_05610, partial [Deltaproteobacteria bacterium]|nr:hypothetical protein [Deltaproteobacteria bacterium]
VLTPANKSLVSPHWRMASGTKLSEGEEMLFHDPQTSGGLLLSIRPADAEQCLAALHRAGITAAAIAGEVFKTEKPMLEIV